jgi:YggT family protein
MLAQILLLIVDSVCGLLALALLARFTLQCVRTSFRNPLGQFVIAVTDWAVRPARRLIPGLFGYDLATLLLAWLTQVVALGIAWALSAALGTVGAVGAVSPAPTFLLIALALCDVAKLEIYLLIGVVLASAIFSWVNPHAPLADVCDAVSRPLLRPFRRFIPPLGGVDLSPLALLLVLQIGLMLLERLRFFFIAP